MVVVVVARLPPGAARKPVVVVDDDDEARPRGVGGCRKGRRLHSTIGQWRARGDARKGGRGGGWWKEKKKRRTNPLHLLLFFTRGIIGFFVLFVRGFCKRFFLFGKEGGDESAPFTLLRPCDPRGLALVLPRGCGRERWGREGVR